MLSELEAGLGYTFRDKSILENALTHSSYANENRERGLHDNERLEFLGDSILGFVVADYLYRSFPDKPEGELTRIRADLVCEKNLARAAATIRLGSFLLLGQMCIRDRILSALTLLEVKGYVKRLPARYYELAKK